MFGLCLIDEQQNPYKPTYTFPDQYDGDMELMEDYIRKAASQTIDSDNKRTDRSVPSPVQVSNFSLRDYRPTPASRSTHDHVQKILRFDDQSLSQPAPPSSDELRPTNDTLTHISAASSSINSRSNNETSANTKHSNADTRVNDNEQKSIYKRVLRGGDIPSTGLQRLAISNDLFKSREKPTNSDTNGTNDKKIRTTRQTIPNGTHRRSNSASQRDSHPIYKALALHSFHAQTSRELPFQKGDILLVTRRINDDWLEGECHGSTGIFPLNHVELFPATTTDTEQEEHENDEDNEDERCMEGEAIVKYDFIPQETFELQLRKGDTVILLRRIDDNWYEGRLNHIEGILPAAYVQTLKEPGNPPIKPPEIDRTQLPSNATKVHSMPKGVLKKPVELQQTSVEKVNLVVDPSLTIRKCQVLYDYMPQNPDELEIHPGDIINIIEMCDDGWYCGMMEQPREKQKMQFGTFPGNYVKLLPA